MVLGGWEIWFTVAPEGPELSASYWDSLIGAWRELRSYDTPLILSRPGPQDKAGLVLPSKPLSLPPALWKDAVVVLVLDLLSLKFVPSCANLNGFLLIKWIYDFSLVASQSILSVRALKSCCLFPSSAARAVCTQVSLCHFLLFCGYTLSAPSLRDRFIMKNDPVFRNHKVLCLPLNYCFILISNYVLKTPRGSRR